MDALITVYLICGHTIHRKKSVRSQKKVSGTVNPKTLKTVPETNGTVVSGSDFKCSVYAIQPGGSEEALS
jgi:hypothetical protein